MKRPYLHKQGKGELKPFFVYAAKCLFDIESMLGEKKAVTYTVLKTGVLLVWYQN